MNHRYSVYKSPWFVVFDPFLDAVIICIRGTKSMKDTTTSMRRRITVIDLIIRFGPRSI